MSMGSRGPNRKIWIVEDKVSEKINSDSLEQMLKDLHCEHEMEDLHLYSCEGDFDLVVRECVKCGNTGTYSAKCIHEAAPAPEQRW